MTDSEIAAATAALCYSLTDSEIAAELRHYVSLRHREIIAATAALC